MTWKRFKRALSGVLCCLASVAAVPTNGSAETIQTGMIGAANAAGWPWYIGIAKGWFAEADITLDLVYVPTAAGLVQQLSAGSLDMVGDVGAVEPIHAVAKGAPVALIRIIGQVPPYAMLAKPGIGSLKELRGKTICIGGLIDINRVYLRRMMEANGLRDGDYDITVIGNTGGRFAALKAGAIDATMLAPPVSFFAEDAGFRNVGLIDAYAHDLPFSATDVSLAYARTHHDALAKVLGVLDRSVAWFNDASHRDESIEILAKEMKAKREPIARSYDFLRKLDYFAPSNAVSRAKLRSLINEMKALGDLKQDVAPEAFVLSDLARLVD